MKTQIRLQLSLLGLLLAVSVAQGDLVHRYSFNETSGTTVKDSAGTADGVLKGNGGSFDGSGQLILNGGTTSAADPSTLSGYVDLPNGIIKVLTNLTVETWITWSGGGQWQRIFDFGTSAGGEDVVNGDGNYLFFTTTGPNNIRFAVRDPVRQNEDGQQATAGGPPEIGVEMCLTVTYDPAANVSRVYSNGVQIASSGALTPLSTINDVNNWLGRSQWNDEMFAGSYNEFRIYDTALNALEVAASCVSGPATPSTDVAALGAIQSVHLNAPKTALVEEDIVDTAATADFASFSNVRLAGISGVTYTPQNPSIVSVDTQGRITAVSAGNTTVTLGYLGKSDVVSFTVARRQEGLANAGTNYVDVRAADFVAGATEWTNRAGIGNFFAEGVPALVANVQNTGKPGVQFSGTDAFVGPPSNEDLETSSDRSIEVWVYNPAVAAEETLVAWAHRGGPDRSNMSFNYGANGAYGAVGHWGEDVGWNGTPVAGNWHYLVYTYDGTNGNTVRVFADGVQKNSRAYPTPLDTYIGFPMRLGAQATTDGGATDFGQSLTGYIGLVRVHGGVLSPNDIKNNFLYGMELTPPGELQGITLSLDASTLTGIPSRAQASVHATYANRNYLFVNSQSTFTSSNTNVATVDAAGQITAVAPGSVDITANYLGKESKQTLQILAAPPAILVHRYSFNEPVGSTTVEDLVGTADGTVKGEGAAFDGAGQLSIPGGATSAVEPPPGYVDLPNGIISVLTNVSFEAWFTWEGTGEGPWQRIFDLGTSDGGEDIVNGNGAYLFLAANSTANLRFAVRDPATASEPVVLTAAAPPPTNSEVYVTVTYNYSANETRMYSNAVQVGSGPASVPLRTINDVNNWLGRSQWNDQMFHGKYNEFRIWDGTLTPGEIAAANAAGPNVIPTPTPTSPSLQATRQANTLVISWPGDATGYAPESTSTLGPQPTWTPVPGTPTQVNGRWTLSVPITDSNQFIRLRK